MVVVPEAPEELLRLATGTRLTATIATRPAPGLLQLSAPFGSFTAQAATSLPFPPGASVLLQVLGRGPSVSLQVLTIDGRPVGEAARAPVGLTGGAATATPAQPATAPRLAVGAVFTANRVSFVPGLTPPSATVGSGTSSAAAPGAAISLGGSPALRSTGDASPAVAGRAAVNTGAAAATPTGLQDYARHAARNLAEAEGRRLPVRVVSLRPPPATGAPTPPPTAHGASPPTSGTTLSGVISGATADGRPVLQTPLGPLVLPTLPAQVGTGVTLQVLGATVTGALDGVGSHDLAGFRDWPALRETAALLQQSEPAAARHLLENIVPQPNSRLTSGLLVFLSALRGGDVRGWLGDQVSQAVDRQRPDLLARLGEDFRTIARLADEPPGEWRPYLVPLFSGEAVEPIRLFMQRRGDPRRDGDKEPGDRLLVDVTLSRIGHLQLDGWIRGRAKRFDMVVRTAEPLPSWMQRDIRGLFEGALDATGMAGGITFRFNPPDFVVVPVPEGDPGPDLVV